MAETNPFNIAICTFATSQFQYALKEHAQGIHQNLFAAGITDGHFILVTDLEPIPGVIETYQELLGSGFCIHHVPIDVDDANKHYDERAQAVIAKLITAAFNKARGLGVDYVWTLESDVIPNPNNLRCMLDMLSFDDGYYDVAFVPYVSQGGGGIMGGHGTHHHHILPNVYEDEREIPEELAEKLRVHREVPNESHDEEWHKTNGVLMREVEQCPPIGNVFALNAKKFRNRGWLEMAYPGVGKGAVLPSDWMPFGNNLFSRKAVALVDFTGYENRGTQDLYCGFARLRSNGLRICVIPHCLSHHVIRLREDESDREKVTGYSMCYMFHEPDGSEVAGHIRHRQLPFHAPIDIGE